MASPLSLRLDENTRQRLERIARSRNVPASRIVREAITRWMDAEQGGARPWDAVSDLVGIAHGGNPARSENAGRRFAQLLEKNRTRRK